MGMHEDDGPYVYRCEFALADGRWWGATVVAMGGDEAKDAARAACPEPDATLLLFDRTSQGIDPIVLDASTSIPRGWIGTRG
jgi:hypothetical protein